eukprot:1167717-Alexandrium_andersonii.AAC.1
MSASLVGSEMCIRDRFGTNKLTEVSGCGARAQLFRTGLRSSGLYKTIVCLLYTSDAADDM